MSKVGNCCTCKFSEQITDPRPYDSWLVCRRYPPVVKQSDGGTGKGRYAVLPTVDRKDWCGEWKV